MIYFVQTKPQLRIVGGKDVDVVEFVQEFRAAVERQKAPVRLPPAPDDDE